MYNISSNKMVNNHFIIIVNVIFFCILISKIQSQEIQNNKTIIKGSQALDNVPLIDGHNDLANNIHLLLSNKINSFDFNRDLSDDPLFGFQNCNTCHTDLVRLQEGKVGAQFWAAYVDCKVDKDNAVSRTLDQIDVIKRLINKYDDVLEFTTTADGIRSAFFREHKIASLIGVEGGHSIDNKLSVLRMFYDLGVRYMTLTHICNLPWADASPVDLNHSYQNNLTSFGEEIILEMNRLGMIVDLSHVSYAVMSRALEVSEAPVIFSHSSVYAIFATHRNVRNDILLKLKENNGIIMINFFSGFIGTGNVTIYDVINHINYVADLIGVDHVGIGADFDGVNGLPVGLEDVSKYPELFNLLHETNPNRWSVENLEKLAGRNFLRVFEGVEKVKRRYFLAYLIPTLSIYPPKENLITDSADEEETNLI